MKCPLHPDQGVLLSRLVVLYWYARSQEGGVVGLVRFVSDAWRKVVVRFRQCGRASLENDAATAP